MYKRASFGLPGAHAELSCTSWHESPCIRGVFLARTRGEFGWDKTRLTFPSAVPRALLSFESKSHLTKRRKSFPHITAGVIHTSSADTHCHQQRAVSGLRALLISFFAATHFFEQSVGILINDGLM